MATVLAAMRKNKNLKSLKLNYIKLSNRKLQEYLKDFLKHNKEVSEIQLSWLSLAPIVLVDIARLITKKKNLHYLDLSWNNMQENRLAPHILE